MNIDFPFQFDSRGQTAHTDENNHIRDMIEQFLFTNQGERVNRPEFGSGLMQLIFAPNSPELATTLQFTAQAGLQQWLGDLIEIQELNVSSQESSLSIVISYMLRRTQEIHTATINRGATP